MRAIVSRPDFLKDNYLSTDIARAGDAAAHQRLQPAGDQRDRRQHLGQLLVAVVQGSPVGRQHHVVRSLHRRAAPVRDAGRRPRLHARSVADRALVDGAVSAQQQRRPLRAEPVGRRAHARLRGLDPADALAGARACTTRCSATKVPERSTARRRRRTSRSPRAICPISFRRTSAPFERSFPRRSRTETIPSFDRPDPGGNAGRLAREHAAALGGLCAATS